MESYSHDQFQVSGYKITTNGNHAKTDITEAWERFRLQNPDIIEHKADTSVHCVYYNYTDPEDPEQRGYDVLIGFMTEPGSMQSNYDITTITVPKQNYRYVTVPWEGGEALAQKWHEIGKINPEELDRTYGYDLEMYNKALTEVYLAVAVK